MLGISDYLFFANTNMKQKTIGKTFAHHIYLHLYFNAFADSPFTKKTHSPKAHKIRPQVPTETFPPRWVFLESRDRWRQLFPFLGRLVAQKMLARHEAMKFGLQP